MNDVETFMQLPLAAQAAVAGFAACNNLPLGEAALRAAPGVFFLRRRPEKRLLMLLMSPVLLILWPIVLYGAFLKSRGIDSGNLDFGDD